MALPGSNFPPYRPGIFGGSPIAVTVTVEYGALGGVFVDPIKTGGRYPAGSPGGVGGQFKTTYGELDALNRGFEERLRNRWADIAAEKRTDRPRTQRLENAIRDPRNGTTTGGSQIGLNFGFAVGIPGFLDSQAKYWRIIEQGTAVAAPNWLGPMVDKSGIPLYVTNGRFNKKGEPRAWTQFGGEWSPGPTAYTKDTTEGKLFPASPGLRRKLFERGWQAPIRTKPIPPLDAYRTAWSEVMGPQAQKYFSELRDVTLPILGVSPARAREIANQLRRSRT